MWSQIQRSGNKSAAECPDSGPTLEKRPASVRCVYSTCPIEPSNHLPLSEANSGIYLWGPESPPLQGFSDKWSALAQSFGYCKPAEVFWRWFWLVIGGKRFVSPEIPRSLTRFTPFKEDSSNIWRKWGPWSPGLWAMSMPEALLELLQPHIYTASTYPATFCKYHLIFLKWWTQAYSPQVLR